MLAMRVFVKKTPKPSDSLETFRRSKAEDTIVESFSADEGENEVRNNRPNHAFVKGQFGSEKKATVKDNAKPAMNFSDIQKKKKCAFFSSRLMCADVRVVEMPMQHKTPVQYTQKNLKIENEEFRGVTSPKALWNSYVRSDVDSSARAKQMVALQNEAFSNFKEAQKPDEVEMFEDYIRELKACEMSYGDVPKNIPVQRIRRKISEGSYPNWTVDELELPSLLRFVWKGKIQKVLTYLQDNTKYQKVNKEDSRGRTALHYAASWGCLRTLNILLQIPGIELNKRDEHGKTPLFKAVEINSFECVKALLKAGANPKITARDSRDPLTAILHFYGDERFDMFKFLYEQAGYHKDETAPYFVSLLHKAIAAEKGTVNLKIVNYLIENGHDMLAVEGKSRTPLHLAVLLGRVDLLYIFLAYDPNIFHSDDDLKTIVNYAAKNTLLRATLDDFYVYGPPSIEKAIACRRAGDNLNMTSVLQQYQQW